MPQRSPLPLLSQIMAKLTSKRSRFVKSPPDATAQLTALAESMARGTDARTLPSVRTGEPSGPSGIEDRQLRAADIRAKLDELVLGQVEAKERLSLLLSMHQSWEKGGDRLHPPPNGLIVGPTGSGKTFSIQVAASFLRIPFLIVDSTTLVPHGAVNGTTIETIRDRLNALSHRYYSEEGKTVSPQRRRAIVFFDEFDKITSRQDDKNKNWKDDVQRALLKFIEGQSIEEDTASEYGVLVLAGGAFVGIDETENIRKRGPEVTQLLRPAPKGTIVSEDFVNFGFMPELIARLPAIIQYDPLPQSVLLAILDHPKTSPLLVWQNHFSKLDKTLDFTQEFRSEVARRAATLKMGARALQQVIFPALARHAYAFESSSEENIVITYRHLEY